MNLGPLTILFNILRSVRELDPLKWCPIKKPHAYVREWQAVGNMGRNFHKTNWGFPEGDCTGTETSWASGLYCSYFSSFFIRLREDSMFRDLVWIIFSHVIIIRRTNNTKKLDSESFFGHDANARPTGERLLFVIFHLNERLKTRICRSFGSEGAEPTSHALCPIKCEDICRSVLSGSFHKKQAVSSTILPKSVFTFT